MVQHPASVVSQSHLLVWGGSGIVWGRWKPTASLPMTGAQTQTLEALMRAKTSPQRVSGRGSAWWRPKGSPITRWPIAGDLASHRSAVADTVQRSGTRWVCPRMSRMGQCHRLSPRKVRASVEATRQTTPPDATLWRTPRESAMPAWHRSRTRTAGTRTGSKRSSGRRPRAVWRRGRMWWAWMNNRRSTRWIGHTGRADEAGGMRPPDA